MLFQSTFFSVVFDKGRKVFHEHFPCLSSNRQTTLYVGRVCQTWIQGKFSPSLYRRLSRLCCLKPPKYFFFTPFSVTVQTSSNLPVEASRKSGKEKSFNHVYTGNARSLFEFMSDWAASSILFLILMECPDSEKMQFCNEKRECKFLAMTWNRKFVCWKLLGREVGDKNYVIDW